MSLSSVLAAGTTDFNAVVCLIFSGIALQLIGAIIEQEKRLWKVLLWVGIWIEGSIGYTIVWYTLSSVGNISLFKILEMVSYSFYYSLFPINSVLDVIYRKDCFIKTDWIYNILSLSSKLGLFWLQVGQVEDKLLGGSFGEIQLYGLGIILPIILLVLGVYVSPSCIPQTPSCACEADNISYTKSRLYKIATFKIVPEPETKTVYVTKKSRHR